MASKASIGTMIAATALIAWPVLAQTTGNTTTSPAAPGMSTSRTTTTTTTTPNTAAGPSTSAPKYFTSDHQVRVSKVVGASVYNDQNQSIGSVDDLLMTDGDRKAATAVLSVGGFLGLGTKYVVVPFTSLKIVDKKIVLPGGDKDALKSLPDFKYNTNS